MKAGKIFRADDWWSSKAALLMGFVYLFSLWFHIPAGRFPVLALLSLAVIAGFASLGYLINDLFDLDKDKAAGKRNFLLGKSLVLRTGLFILSLALTLAPWLYLPADRISFLLIGLELTLFVVYSYPPIRLKERGALGILTDALYAHAVPVALAAYTFALAGAPAPQWYIPLAFLLSWQLLAGMRNILVHQYEDAEADTATGTRTYVMHADHKKIFTALRWLCSAELSCVLLFFAVMGVDQWRLALGAVLVFFLALQDFFWYAFLLREDIPEAPLRYFPNHIYEQWLPVFYLVLLSMDDRWFLVVLILHITLFNARLYVLSADAMQHGYRAIPFIRIWFGLWLPVRTFVSAVINYTIYYTLLLFGIDLRKENMSAVDYFKRKRSAEQKE
ncbi:MAG: UbiA family prenyltransferase [Bacteroidetes bacterium]|nr:UbiA family prenyltransferase [Bacteroidota bacterium]